MNVFHGNPSFSTFSGRFVRVVHTVNRQPSWVIRAALGAGVLVLLAILALILVPVVVVMLIVFTLAAGLARVRRWFSPLRAPDTLIIVDDRASPRDSDRRNVRVVQNSAG